MELAAPVKRRIGYGILDFLGGIPLFATAPLYRHWHMGWGATEGELRRAGWRLHQAEQTIRSGWGSGTDSVEWSELRRGSGAPPMGGLRANKWRAFHLCGPACLLRRWR